MKHSLTWRKSPDRINAARQVLDSQEMQAMLATMELDHPSKSPMPLKDGFEATYRIGFIDGFEHCLATLRNLGVSLPTDPVALKSTWGIDGQPSKQ